MFISSQRSHLMLISNLKMFVCVFVSSYRLNFRAPLVNFVMRWHNFTVDRIIQYVSRKRKRINISLIAIDEWFIFVLATVYLEWLLQHRPLHQIILWTKWQVVWLRHCHLHFLQMDFFENWLKFHWRFFQWLKWHWISIGWSIWASARPNQMMTLFADAYLSQDWKKR